VGRREERNQVHLKEWFAEYGIAIQAFRIERPLTRVEGKSVMKTTEKEQVYLRPRHASEHEKSRSGSV
jgi:hypothetical protein